MKSFFGCELVLIFEGLIGIYAILGDCVLGKLMKV